MQFKAWLNIEGLKGRDVVVCCVEFVVGTSNNIDGQRVTVNCLRRIDMIDRRIWRLSIWGFVWYP
jgi:hypothetical protein